MAWIRAPSSSLWNGFVMYSSAPKPSPRTLNFLLFKQKTAYEIMPSLVGSEMCIRDRRRGRRSQHIARPRSCPTWARSRSCLLYTSDAADDLLCVDLGGRRIIQQKN